MSTNLLKAITHLIENPIFQLKAHYQTYKVRINNEGLMLEHYIRDLFCNTLTENNLSYKNEIYSQNFSYLGNQNNPPDLILKNGDAIEIKKIENFKNQIALNSSYPKNKLYANSPLITQACRECETDWQEKDILYIIGIIKNDELKGLWFVYGDCYAADEKVYTRIKDSISTGLQNLENIEFSPTNELARINQVDPLGITYLRVRGMWGIENPFKVFDYLLQDNFNKDKFFVYAILTQQKYESFPDADRIYLENLKNANFSIQTVNLRSPNNPAHLIQGKLLSFSL